MNKQPELTGVVGYLSAEDAKHLKAKKSKEGTVDLKFESNNDKVLMRVKREDIRDVLAADGKNGETKVHLILAPGSVVETVVKMFRDVKAIEDPTLTRLTAASNVSVSFV